MSEWPSKDEAQAILDEWTKNKNLKKHGYAVEAAMRAYAKRLGGDAEQWGVVGLLHDFDYERYPDLADHPWRGVEYLRERGYPEELVEGVLAHAEHTGAERDTPMKKAIFAVDELTVESVLKKWDEKRFAAGVDRKLIEQGAEELGVPLEDHIQTVLTAMQGVSDKLGL